MTCPGLSPISQREWAGSWYWRLTEASLGRLLQTATGGTAPEVHSHGNVLAACAFLYGLAAEELLPDELDYHDPNYEVTLTARVAKPEITVRTGSQATVHSHP